MAKKIRAPRGLTKLQLVKRPGSKDKARPSKGTGNYNHSPSESTN